MADTTENTDNTQPITTANPQSNTQGDQSLTSIRVYQEDIVPGAVTQPALSAGGNQKGDLYYGQDGVRFARLPIGSSGQTLRSIAGIPTWTSGGSVPFGITTFINSVGTKSITSGTLAQIDASFACTVTLKYGNFVRVDVRLGGLYNSNSGYVIGYDVGLDGITTLSTSGTLSSFPNDESWKVDASNNTSVNGVFFFTNVTPGSHTFNPLWCSSAGVATAYMSQYSFNYITVMEVSL